jgi:hypothetical protein
MELESRNRATIQQILAAWSSRLVGSPEASSYDDVVRTAILHCLRPCGQAGDACTVLIPQNEAGRVFDAAFQRCTASDPRLPRSIEDAVWRASPLPLPADPDRFVPRLRLEFIVSDHAH